MGLLHWTLEEKKSLIPEKGIQKLKGTEEILIKKLIGKAEGLIANIAEQQELAQHIPDAASHSVGLGDDRDEVTEDELLQDLEELEQEELTQELLSVGNKEEEPPPPPPVGLPGVPYTHLSAGPGPKAHC